MTLYTFTLIGYNRLNYFTKVFAMQHFRLASFTMIAALFFALSSFLTASPAAQKLDKKSDLAVAQFLREVKGGQKFLDEVKGYLIFPEITKAGFMIGGSYGEGALRVNGHTKHYYSVTSASFGFQAGAQQHAMLIAFLSEASLNNFINSNGWEAGVDGSIAIIDNGFSKDISSISYEKPIIAFVYGEKGLMGSLSIKGNKFQKIIP